MAKLQRTLGLRDLVIMGLILVQPTAPMPLFGVVNQQAHGHVVTAIRQRVHLPAVDPALFTRPFSDPRTFSVQALSAGSALAVLTYIGFDGISTLSEEVKDPRRNILLGTVLTCLLIGVLSAIEVYA